jgi:hypothetical protein
VRRSANTVAVVSVSESRTLTRPLFSAMKTLPSGANETEVGAVRPPMAGVSVKPVGTAAAAACGKATAVAATTTVTCLERIGLRRSRRTELVPFAAE